MNLSPCLTCRWGTWYGFRQYRHYICTLFTLQPVKRCDHYQEAK